MYKIELSVPHQEKLASLEKFGAVLGVPLMNENAVQVGIDHLHDPTYNQFKGRLAIFATPDLIQMGLIGHRNLQIERVIYPGGDPRKPGIRRPVLEEPTSRLIFKRTDTGLFLVNDVEVIHQEGFNKFAQRIIGGTLARQRKNQQAIKEQAAAELYQAAA